MSSDSSFSARPRPATPLLRRIPKKLVLGLLGALFVFDILFYLLAVEPLGRREAEQQALLSALQRQIETKQKDISQLQLVVSKVGQARTEGDHLLEDITLLRRTAFSTLLAELLEAASKSGIDTREGNFDIEPIEGTDEYGMIAVSANFRGRYQNLVKLVNELDRSSQFLIIESLGAAPRPDSDDLQITMRLNTFLREL
jgi:Type II secretion system (T2SS), protein M subtype b